MNHVERFRALMDFQPVDRLPRWEWAMWWDKTIDRWKQRGSARPAGDRCSTSPNTSAWTPTSSSGFRPPIRRSRPCSTTSRASSRTWTTTCGCGRSSFPITAAAIESMRPWAALQQRGEAVVWITLEGYFWFPRTLMGFTKVSLALYDQPELIHRINQDLTDFNLSIIERVAKVCRPTFATIAEDMSYNNGPMISERHFDEFIAPYYRQIVPRLRELGATVARRYRRRRHPDGPLADARRDSRRAAAGTAGRRGRHGPSQACSRRSAWSGTSTRW